MTAPGCWFVIACLIAGVGYLVSLVLLGYIPENGPIHLKNCTEPIPKNLTELLYAHVIFGAFHLLLLALVIIYRIINCGKKKKKNLEHSTNDEYDRI